MSRPTTLPSPWSDLALAAGGVGELATLLGVSRRTIERWGAGTVPRAIVQAHVVAFAKRRGVAIDWSATSDPRIRGRRPRDTGAAGE